MCDFIWNEHENQVLSYSFHIQQHFIDENEKQKENGKRTNV